MGSDKAVSVCARHGIPDCDDCFEDACFDRPTSSERMLFDVDPRYVRVILAADAFTREVDRGDLLEELSMACERISDDELEALRGA